MRVRAAATGGSAWYRLCGRGSDQGYGGHVLGVVAVATLFGEWHLPVEPQARYFPGLCQKGRRLYELDAFVQEVVTIPVLRLQSIKCFRYGRISSLEQLVERARAHHYSTFWLYSAEELEKAIAGIRQNAEYHLEDVDKVK